MTGQEIKAVVLDSIPLRKAGRFEEALALVEAALARDPEAPLLLSAKGAILHELERNDEAAALHEAAVERVPRLAEQGQVRNEARQT
ncbi:MAG TPA: tetratricopeptide repeat protein, partial [Ktedonobacterales bacterium]|nr:tetratricopeptide repeat protein [Ktedonobacterales bacterium]